MSPADHDQPSRVLPDLQLRVPMPPVKPARDPAGHIWRAPRDGEPLEEGGVCQICAAYATSEGRLPCPVNLTALDAARRMVAAWRTNDRLYSDHPDEDLAQRIVALVGVRKRMVLS